MQFSLETLKVYQSAMTIGEDCWELVSKWDSFAKQTLGNQLVRAADSIAANISEGYGRYSFKENKLFCY
jgi:four helix bundle protein